MYKAAPWFVDTRILWISNSVSLPLPNQMVQRCMGLTLHFVASCILSCMLVLLHCFRTIGVQVWSVGVSVSACAMDRCCVNWKGWKTVQLMCFNCCALKVTGSGTYFPWFIYSSPCVYFFLLQLCCVCIHIFTHHMHNQLMTHVWAKKTTLTQFVHVIMTWSVV